MTNKEYFQQAQRLEQKIASDITEVAEMREMLTTISSPAMGVRVQTNRPEEAPYVRGVERIAEMEARIDAEVDALVDLKEEMRAVIEALPNWGEQMVMRYRYFCNMSWEDICDKMGVTVRTAQRYHSAALEHAVIPEKKI